MKKSIFSLFLMSSVLWAQDKKNVVYNDDKVLVTTEIKECNDDRKGVHRTDLILNFENLSNESQTFTFKKQMSYNGNCINCDSESTEHVYTVELAPMTIIENQCFGDKSTYATVKVNAPGAKSKLTDLQIIKK